ncbi:MAG: redoxin domain-containing protein [Planctomycetes bacterium]|nr:redoxin domain-containing protein [Planctomycetota bacterium]
MKQRLMIVLCGAALVAAWSATQACAGEEKATPKPGDQAPDFALKDVDGKTVKLSDLAGKVVVLEWLNQQCPVSRGKHTERSMQKTAAKFKDQPVVWLGIDSSHYADPEANKKYAAKMEMVYAILHDSDGKVGKSYGAKTTPHMFVIDQKGKIVYAGAPDNAGREKPKEPRNYVAEAVEATLNGSTIAVASTRPYGCSVKYGK